MIYITSDFHISHENIMKYCNRYKSHRNITDYIDNLFYHLQSLKETDIFFYLGDLACSKDKSIELCKKYIDKIKCKEKHFIRGNHDTWLTDDDLKYIGFKTIKDYLVIKKTLFCHYSLDSSYGKFGNYKDHKYLWDLFYNNDDIKTIIHGHIHNNRTIKIPGKKFINVSIDKKIGKFNIYTLKNIKEPDFLKEIYK